MNNNNDEDSLFAPATKAADDSQPESMGGGGGFSISASQMKGLTTNKKRTNSKIYKKKDGGAPADDNLFAPVAAERPSVAANKRNLSQDFFKRLESNNLKSAVVDTKESERQQQKEPRGRGSVAAHAAMFESNIRASSKPQPELKKINNGRFSEVNSNQGSQRGSVKNLVMQFQSNISTNQAAAAADKPANLNRGRVSSMAPDLSSKRKSLGDAFLQNMSKHKGDREKEVVERGSQHSIGLNNNRDDRLSLGDNFMNAVNRNRDIDDDKKSVTSAGLLKQNIFNKVRAITKGHGGGASGFSRKSEADIQSQQERPQNIFMQNKDNIVDQDDGGVDAGLITANQMMTNLVRKNEEKKQVKVVGGVDESQLLQQQDVSGGADNGMLDNIENWAGSPPKSPDQIKERNNNMDISNNKDEVIVFAEDKQDRVVSDVKPAENTRPQFDLSNQIRELKIQAVDHRSARDSSQGSTARKRILTIKKKLGKAADVAPKKQESQLTADIIVYQDKSARVESKKPITLTDKDGQDVIMAPTAAAPRRNTVLNENHDRIGRMVAAQEREHVSQEREFKLEFDKKGAKKVGRGGQQKSPREMKPQDRFVIKKSVTLTNISAKEEKSIDETKIITGANQSDLFAMENSREVQQKLSLNITTDHDKTAQSNVSVKKRSEMSQEGSRKGSSRRGRGGVGNSSMRNDDFLEYVIGADTLLPKRVRSRKSDLPYSQSSLQSPMQSPQSFSGLERHPQKMFSKSKIDGDVRPKKSRGESNSGKRVIESSMMEEPSSDGGGLRYENSVKEIPNTMQSPKENPPIKYSQFSSSNSSDDDDDDDADLDEVDRMIADQEKLLNDYVQDSSKRKKRDQEHSGKLDDTGVPLKDVTPYEEAQEAAAGKSIITFKEESMIRRGNQAMANFLNSSKDSKSDISGFGQTRQQNQQLEQLQHEIELEEMALQESHKLEAAISQAQQKQQVDDTIPSQVNGSMTNKNQGNDRSQLDFNNVSNIHHLLKQEEEESFRDISAMEAIESATQQKKRPVTTIDMTTPEMLRSKVKTSLSGMPSISDVADIQALRNNYLERSANSQSQAADVKSNMEKNQREKQLRYELEILELELELQMAEAELSDEDDVDQLANNQARVTEMKNSVLMTNNGGGATRETFVDNEDQQEKLNNRQNFNSIPFGAVTPDTGYQSRDNEGKIDSFRAGSSRLLQSEGHGKDMQTPLRTKQQQRQKNPGSGKTSIVLPINVEDQEVLCSNCYETIPMQLVDKHSNTCVQEQSFRQSMGPRNTNITIDEEQEFQGQTAELNDRIFKLIQTFLRKLDSQIFLDEIYTTHANEDNSQINSFWDEERGGKVPSSIQGSARSNKKPQNQRPVSSTNYQKSATALAEERSLIHEVVQHAHLALQGELYDLQSAAESLDQLEDEHDLNQKFEFNNHMVFNRILQAINIKLEVMQEYEKKLNPDIVVPLTTKQMREKEDKFHFGFSELSLANVKKLPLPNFEDDSDKNDAKTGKALSSRPNHQDLQLHEYIAASRAQAMKAKDKRTNIFANKKGGQGGGGDAQVNTTEHWVLSDMGSDTRSMGGDSNSSISRFSKPLFKGNSVLAKQKQDSSMRE